MASKELPFERGTTWDSGSFGAVPANLVGSTYEDTDGTVLQIVKNTNGTVLNGCRVVKWETNDADQKEVDLPVNDFETRLAGIVDHVYANKGVTVPINALFYVVKKGLTHCIAGVTTIAAADNIVVDSGASDGVRGRVQDIVLANVSGAAATALKLYGAVVGKAIGTQASVGKSVAVLVNL